MHHVRQEQLPFVGSSHEFIGAEQGKTDVSVFLYNGKPVRGQVRTGILTMKSNLFVKGEEFGR